MSEKPEIILPSNASQNISVAGPGFTVKWIPREIEMHTLTTDQIEQLASSGSSVPLTLFGICFGALITLWAVLWTTNFQTPHKQEAAVGAFVASILLSIFFLAISIRDILEKKSELKNLLKGKVTSQQA